MKILILGIYIITNPVDSIIRIVENFVIMNCILFTFTSDKQCFIGAIEELIQKNYSVTTIVNLSENSELELPTSYSSRHISQYGLESGKGFREVSNQWVLNLGHSKLKTGKSLVESLVYKEIPIWWLAEIGLQEKSFRIIRFIETVNYILDTNPADAFATVGDGEEKWNKPIMVKIGLYKNMKHLDCIQGQIRTEENEKRANEIRIIGKLLKNDERRLAKLRSVLLSLPIAIAFSLLATQNKSFASRLVLFPSLISTLVMTNIRDSPDLTLSQSGSLIAHRTGVTDYLNSSMAKTEKKIQNFNKRLGNLPRNCVNKITNFLAGKKLGTHTILIVCEADAIKNRRSLVNYKRSQYHPYLENIPQALQTIAQREKLDVFCLHHGTSFLKIPKLIDSKHSITFSGFLKRKHFEAESTFSKLISEFNSKLNDDDNFKKALFYKGLDISEYFMKDLCDCYTNTVKSILSFEIFVDIIEKIKPLAVVMNNYEGTFRSIVSACVLKQIPTVGIQQALGPYVHALNKLEYGLQNIESDNKLGFPIPEKIALWGKVHEKNFLSYGFKPNMLDVTGYCRLDTFVNEKSSLDHGLLKERLGLPKNCRIIIFTGTFHPPGVYVTLEDNFIKTIKQLTRIAQDFPQTFVLVKPWSGDKINHIIELVQKFGNDKFVFVHPNTDIHNVELLAISDVLVGSFSSIFSESIVMDCPVIFMDYPESRFYDEPEHIKLVEDFVTKIERPDQVYEHVTKLLENKKNGLVNDALRNVFGPLDGHSSRRIAEIATSLAKNNQMKH